MHRYIIRNDYLKDRVAELFLHWRDFYHSKEVIRVHQEAYFYIRSYYYPMIGAWDGSYDMTLITWMPISNEAYFGVPGRIIFNAGV